MSALVEFLTARLDEVISWAMNAKEIGIPGESKPTVVIKFGSGRIKKIEVKG